MKAKIELTFEKASEFQSRKIGYQFYSLVSDPKKNPSIENMLETMDAIANVIQAKVGRGGNHVWISNPDNERIAIITFR